MEKLFGSFIGILIFCCQIVVAGLFGAVVIDWFGIEGSGFIYFLKCGLVIGAAIFVMAIIPLGELLACCFVYYWCVWEWDFNPIISFIVIFPGIVVAFGGALGMAIAEFFNRNNPRF